MDVQSEPSCRCAKAMMQALQLVEALVEALEEPAAAVATAAKAPPDACISCNMIAMVATMV